MPERNRRKTDNSREFFETLSREELVDKLVQYDRMLRGALNSNQKESAYQKRQRETDDLTRVLNRAGLQSAYLERLEHRERYEDKVRPDLVAMVDLDKFKEINDSAGHPAGDIALRSVANLIKANTRRDDIVGRYGGDEFIIFILNATLEEGRKVGEKIRSKAEEASMISKPGHLLPTLSIGIAEVDYSLSFSEMYHKADVAMYAAKVAGRNQVHLLSPGDEL
jgi:diguanylate cyclase (GGDEF)-like protein